MKQTRNSVVTDPTPPARAHEQCAWTVRSMVARNGYRHLGLHGGRAMNGVNNAERCGEVLERFEHRTGSNRFRTHGFTALHVDVACELAHVYLALRRMVPSVMVDRLDVRAAMADDSLALSTSYDEAYPLLRSIHDEDGISDPDQARARLIELGWARSAGAGAEIATLWQVSDLAATGSIELSRNVISHAGYRRIEQYWEEVRARRLAAGRAPRHRGLDVSPGAYLLCHEYGHLVEAALWRHDSDVVEHVYGTLSTAVHGREVSATQWRYHLAHYPVAAGTVRDLPNAPNGQRRAETRKVLRRQIGAVLGSYAATNRAELFAEAFAFSLCGTNETRDRFGAFLNETVTALGTTRR